MRKMVNTKEFLNNNQLITYFLKEQYGELKKVTTIGGMTNTNYKLQFNNESLVIRIPQKNTKKMINRVDEKINTYLAFKSGIDQSFLFIDDISGVKISKFLGEGVTLTPRSAKKIENMKKVVRVLKRLHNSNTNFNNIFDPFKMIDMYENILKEDQGEFFKDYKIVKNNIFYFQNSIKNCNFKLVPCHNDTVPENFILNRDKMNLIDWEYSGMNDCVWDLAAHSLECQFSKKEEGSFLNLYFNDNINEEIVLRLNLYKIIQDFLWSIWSNIKIIHGEQLREYSLMRYERAKKMLKSL